MPTKRKLADLYVRGKTVTINDDSGADPVTVYVQKLSPIDTEKALRKANAYRSQLVAQAHDDQSELYLSAYGEIGRLSDEEVLDAVVRQDVGERATAIEAEVEAKDRWSEDNYLQGIHDSWNDEMRDRYATDPEDVEAAAVFAVMTEFTEEVSNRLIREADNLRDELRETRTPEALRKKATEQALMSRVDIQWMNEFRRCQVWLSVRESEKNRTRYFESRAEVDELATETLVQLIKAYTEIEVDVVEGKGSEVTPPSSSSSEQQEAGADSSGPSAQAA